MKARKSNLNLSMYMKVILKLILGLRLRMRIDVTRVHLVKGKEQNRTAKSKKIASVILHAVSPMRCGQIITNHHQLLRREETKK